MADKKNSKKKIFKIGAYSIVLSAIALAIAIAVNLLVGQLPSSWIRIDSTSEKVLSIGDKTKEILKNLDEDITLYHIVTAGNEDSYITEILNRYEEAGSHIKVEKIDPVSRPTFTQTYTSEELYDNSIIAVSEKRSTVISPDDIYMYEMTGYEGQYMTRNEYYYYVQMYQGYGMNAPGATEYFFAENAITRAVDYVHRTELPIMYALGGHGEADVTTGAVADLCVAENFELKTLALQSGEETKVPEDAASVMINAPAGDISDGELEALKDYVNGGGTVLLTTSYRAYNAEGFPNLAAFCEYMGLTAIESPIVETDTAHYTNYIDYLLPDITGSGITSLMQNTNYYFYMVGSHAIKVTDTSANVETYALLNTSDSAYAYSEEVANDPDKAVKMQYTLGYQSVLTDESGTAGGTLIWLGSPLAFDDSFVSGTGNGFLFTAVLQSSGKSSSAISLIGKSMSSGHVNVTARLVYTWIAVECVAVPVILIAAGMIVWIRRRRR